MGKIFVLGVVMAACGYPKLAPLLGGDASVDAPVDAPVDGFVWDAAPNTAYHYVANRVLVPMTTSETTNYGLDLNGDGEVDNRLGEFLANLEALGFNAQAATDVSVLDGSIAELLDIQTTGLIAAPAATFRTYWGASPNPPACGAGEMVTCVGSGASETCSGCGDDFAVTATFELTPNYDSPVTGSISGGTFMGGDGSAGAPIEFALAPDQPILLDLVDAHALVLDVGPAQLSSGIIVAGAVLQSNLEGSFYPQLVPGLRTVQETYCAEPAGSGSGGASCNPTNDTTCGVLTMLMDDTCTITVTSVASSSLINELLTPDLTLPQGEALSIGIKMEAVSAQFTVPGEGSD